MPFPPRFRDGARNAAPSSCRSSLRCRERRAVVRAEPDWLLDALAHRGPPASGFAARVRAWSAVLRGRHGTTTRRAGPARSNDGTCVRPCWPRAHRGRQPCVLIWRTAAAGAWQKTRALRASGGMADAHGSGPCVRKDVGVQLPPCPLPVSTPWYLSISRNTRQDPLCRGVDRACRVGHGWDIPNLGDTRPADLLACGFLPAGDPISGPPLRRPRGWDTGGTQPVCPRPSTGDCWLVGRLQR